MTDPSGHIEANAESGDRRAGRESTTGAPRWVKVVGIVGVAVVALLVVLKLAGGDSGHGPSRHSMPESVVTQAGAHG